MLRTKPPYLAEDVDTGVLAVGEAVVGVVAAGLVVAAVVGVEDKVVVAGVVIVGVVAAGVGDGELVLQPEITRKHNNKTTRGTHSFFMFTSSINSLKAGLILHPLNQSIQ